MAKNMSSDAMDRRSLCAIAAMGASLLVPCTSALGIEGNSETVDAVAVPKIDVHAHILPESYLNGLAAMGISPVDEDGFPTPEWNEDAHVAFMDAVGISYSVLSISTPHIHHGDDEASLALAMAINDETKAVCDRHPGRLGFAACLPLPYVEGSISEARRAFEELGAVGVKVPSNANGVYLGDPSLDPVMEVLQEYGAVVTIHPSRPQAVPENVFTSGPAPLLEYLVDTTRAVLNLCTTGTLDRYPDVKFVVPHCGSFLPELVHRLVGMSTVLVPAGMMEEVDIMRCIKGLYFDIAGTSEPVMLPALMEIAEPSHLLYGSDYPYTPAPLISSIAGGIAADSRMTPELLNGMFYENAARLYGLL